MQPRFACRHSPERHSPAFLARRDDRQALLATPARPVYGSRGRLRSAAIAELALREALNRRTYSAMAPTPQTPDAVDPDVTVNFRILKVIEVIDYLHRAYASHGSIGCIIFQYLMQQDWTGHDAPYAAALPAPYAAALPAPYEVALPGYPA